MSQVASFYKLPIKSLEWDLIQAARLRNRLFRKPLSVLNDYLDKEAEELTGLDGDGTWWLLMLSYLAMHENIDLYEGDKGIKIVTGILNKNQGGCFTILTPRDKTEYLSKISSIVIDPEKVFQLLIAQDLSTPEKARSDIFADPRSWDYTHRRLVEILSSLDSDHIILTSVA